MAKTMLVGTQNHFRQRTWKLATERDSRSRSADVGYRSDSIGDSAKELSLVGFCNLLSFLCQEERNKYYYVIIAKGNFRLTYLAITWNFNKLQIRFEYHSFFVVSKIMINSRNQYRTPKKLDWWLLTCHKITWHGPAKNDHLGVAGRHRADRPIACIKPVVMLLTYLAIFF